MLRRPIVIGALLGLALSGCGTEGPLGAEALGSEAVNRIRSEGVAADLVYLTDLPDFELAVQSAGAYGEEGFQVVYFSPPAVQVRLSVDRDSVTDATCTGPLFEADPSTAPVRCERDGEGWYREGGGRHEYAVVHGDHVVRLNAPLEAVDRETLRAAAFRARPVRLDESVGREHAPASPVERGDLPTSGDGAPDNHVGPGG